MSIAFYSCSDSEEEIPSSEQNRIEQSDKSFDINEIRVANNEELNLISDFINQEEFLAENNFKTKNDFEEPEVVNYTDLPGKAIVLNFKRKNLKTNIEKSLILVTSDQNEIITNYEYEKIDNGDFYTIKTCIEGYEWFTADVDKKTEKVISFSFSKSNVFTNSMTFLECAEMAVSACVDDGVCAFI